VIGDARDISPKTRKCPMVACTTNRYRGRKVPHRPIFCARKNKSLILPHCGTTWPGAWTSNIRRIEHRILRIRSHSGYSRDWMTLSVLVLVYYGRNVLIVTAQRPEKRGICSKEKPTAKRSTCMAQYPWRRVQLHRCFRTNFCDLSWLRNDENLGKPFPLLPNLGQIIEM